ncbi:unnamed protein product, partial [Lymnaea stagnalis]
MGSYQNCVMVQGAVQAAFITMINKFVGGLVELEEAAEDVGDDVLADFKSNSDVSRENLINEVVLLLTFLTDRLEVVSSTSQGKQTLPLLLEGVNIVLSKVPPSIKLNNDFQELLWKRLCPCLISLLGEPKAEKTTGQKSVRPEVAKLTGSSSASPNLTQASAKVIYSIAGELACLVGGIPQLRPVLEALFHKILMFPLPQSRHDALRILKELMSDPKKVVSLIGTATAPAKDNSLDTNMALLKMLIDAVHQSSHYSEPSIVYTSIDCIDGLLASLDRIRQGEAIPDSMIKPTKGMKGRTRRSMTSNPDDDGGSDITCEQYDESEDPITVPEDSPAANEIPPDDQPADQITDPAPAKPKLTPKSPSRAQFEAEERENARQFVTYLRQMMPVLKNAMSVSQVDETLQDMAAQFCNSIPPSHLGHQHDGSSTAVVLNSDGVYVAAIVALKFNLKLIKTGYYRNIRNLKLTENDFTNEIFSSGLLLYLPPAWLKEVYSQVLTTSMLDLNLSSSPSTARVSSSALINML